MKINILFVPSKLKDGVLNLIFKDEDFDIIIEGNQSLAIQPSGLSGKKILFRNCRIKNSSFAMDKDAAPIEQIVWDKCVFLFATSSNMKAKKAYYYDCRIDNLTLEHSHIDTVYVEKTKVAQVEYSGVVIKHLVVVDTVNVDTYVDNETRFEHITLKNSLFYDCVFKLSGELDGNLEMVDCSFHRCQYNDNMIDKISSVICVCSSEIGAPPFVYIPGIDRVFDSQTPKGVALDKWSHQINVALSEDLQNFYLHEHRIIANFFLNLRSLTKINE